LPTISELFCKALESEIQEKVLCHTLEMFGLWSMNFRGEIPPKIIQAFKKGLDAKSQTVRISYLQWFLSCLENAKMPSGSDFTPTLAKLVEKAAANPTQTPVVSEGVGAACIILLTNEKVTENLKDFANIVLDINKQIFLSDRFLSATAVETLCYVMLMCSHILLDYYDDIKGDHEAIYKAIVYCSTSVHKKVRDYCIPLLENMMYSELGPKFAKNILVEMTTYVEKTRILLDGESEENIIPAGAIVDAITAVCSNEDLQIVDSQAVILNALLCSHHPSVVSARPDLWESLLDQYGLEAKSFITMNMKQIEECLFVAYKAIPMYENAVATLVKLSPEIILPILVKNVCDQLNNSKMSNVTDDEYFTYLTPDGELYDKSVLPNADNAAVSTAHLKRENKAYR
jgi:hypothetical protein